MEEALIIHALSKALEWREPAAGLIIHSDRGGQYVGNQFRTLLDKYDCLQSMSRADDAYDNAFESHPTQIGSTSRSSPA